jgi:hypothetical protein
MRLLGKFALDLSAVQIDCHESAAGAGGQGILADEVRVIVVKHIGINRQTAIQDFDRPPAYFFRNRLGNGQPGRREPAARRG